MGTFFGRRSSLRIADPIVEVIPEVYVWQTRCREPAMRTHLFVYQDPPLAKGHVNPFRCPHSQEVTRYPLTVAVVSLSY